MVYLSCVGVIGWHGSLNKVHLEIIEKIEIIRKCSLISDRLATMKYVGKVKGVEREFLLRAALEYLFSKTIAEKRFFSMF